MSIKKYEAFVKTVELGGLTKAAQALGYTQSSMSHILTNLETELGVTLLYRSRSGIKLTAAGERLLPKMQEILEKKQELMDLAASLNGSGHGCVRIGAFTSVSVNWLPGILKAFRADFPGVEIKMLSGDYHDIEQWLIRGEIDVGFIAMPGPEGITCIPLKEDPLVVILPKGHPLADYDEVPIDLAAKEPIISLLAASSQDVRRALGNAGIKPNIQYVTKDDYAIIAMVQAGLGISIMPQLLLKPTAGDVVIKHLTPAASRTIALAMPQTENRPDAADSFARCVIRWVSENA